MKLYIEQLSQHLSKNLAPVYLISGDEPLQMKESVDAIRQAAKSQGYSDREILEQSRDFDWNSLSSSANSLSLFAQKRVIELRMPSGKPGKEGAQVLCQYAENPAEDTILLIQAGKIDKSGQNTKWFKALSQVGVAMQLWPLNLSKMPAWISNRLAQKQLKTGGPGIQLLCDRVEGNLLAAAQEVDKLALLYGKQDEVIAITAEQIASAVADSSRFSLYDLAEAAMLGQLGRSIKILNGLKAEGVASTLVLWVLSSEIRTTAQFSRKIARGQSHQQVLTQVWDARKPVVSAALKRVPTNLWDALLQQCALTDQMIKGIKKGSAWDQLFQLVLMLCNERLAMIDRIK